MTTAVAETKTMDLEELEFESLSWPDKARGLAVTCEADYKRAGEVLLEVKELRGKIAESCDPVIKATHAAHKAATTQKNVLEKPLTEAEGIIKLAMSRWYTLEQRRLQEIARQEAEERRRQEEEARLAEAVALEEEGETELAQQVIEQPSTVAPVAPPAPKAEGIVTREIWSAEIVNLKELCRAIGVGEQPTAILGEVDMTAMNKLAVALREQMRIPGVRAVSRTVIAAGRR